MTLVRVVAPHFVAGIVVEASSMGCDHDPFEPAIVRCTEAAPILRWCIGRDADELRAYFKRKGWQATRVGA